MSDDTQMSPLRVAALQMHEMYSELRKAGFTRKEALTLVGNMISGSSSDD